MTNIGHFRAAGELLEHTGPLSARACGLPGRMDGHQLMEGYYAIFGRAGARTEMLAALSAWKSGARGTQINRAVHFDVTSQIDWVKARMSTSPRLSWLLSVPC